MTLITKKEWKSKKELNYASIIKGEKHILVLDEKTQGTMLMKVAIKDDPYTFKQLVQENQYRFEGSLQKEDVRKVNKLKKLIEKRQEKLTIGDVIECYGKNYKKESVAYHGGHLEVLNYLDEYGLHICIHPYDPHIGLDDKKFYLSTSGGPWFTEKDKSKFSYLGKRKKTFWMWGYFGAGGEKGIQFDAMVNAWKYRDDNKVY